MMNNMVYRKIRDLKKVKKSTMPLLNYLIHILSANELSFDVEVREYDQIKSHQSYKGEEQLETKSSTNPKDFHTLSPSTLAKKKSWYANLYGRQPSVTLGRVELLL